MRGRAESQDWSAGVDEVRDVLHLVLGRLAEAREKHHHVCAFQVFQPDDVRLVVRIDSTVSRVEGKQHGAFEAVPHSQDLGQHRHPFFGAVFLVAVHPDDVFAHARSVLTFVHDPVRGVG